MRSVNRVAVAALAILLAACSDTAGPRDMPGPALSVVPQLFGTPLTLSATQADVWAHADQATTIAVQYLAADSTWQPYASLTIPAGALWKRPDGSVIAAGDSIEIHATFDSTRLYVQLEPTGLTFQTLNPAHLNIAYGAGGLDLNGDGVVNGLDSMIEQTLLGLWVQEGDTAPWLKLPALKDLLNHSISADLAHFSGYAVSW